MEPITTYTSSDGKTTPITELNPFHLLNALVKLARATHSSQSDSADYKQSTATLDALKSEVLRRLAPPTNSPSPSASA